MARHEHGGRAIIIDGDPHSAARFAAIAAQRGMAAVHEAGATNVDLTELRRARCLILELSLTGMDGIDFMAMLAAVAIDTPLILTSALPSRTLEAAGAAGAVQGLCIAGLLPKPCTDAEIHDALSAAQRLRRPEEADLSQAPSETEIVAAFDAGGLRAHFQPKVDLTDDRVVGFESLARLELPDGRLLAPARFLDELTLGGRLGALSDRLLGLALATLQRCRHRARGMHVAVNLPARHLADVDYPARVRDLLEATGAPPEGLCLEITETEFIRAGSLAFETLVRLALMGVRLAVDDFGTGFSSFGQIHKLPCDELKIDRAFVREVDREPHAETIVRKTIELARELGLTVTAEGIETPAQAEMLRSMGCRLGQGFLYGRPSPEPSARSPGTGRALAS